MDLLLSGFMAPKPRFDPAKEIPSLSGKVILITGGTAGLGRETVLSFANHDPAHIFFTGRSQKSADQLLQDLASTHPNVPVTFLKMDLASFASISAGVRTLLAQITRLDILMANAGILGAPPGLTEDGYEVHFGTNHMGHALLAHLLTPILRSTSRSTGGDARIVWCSSLSYLQPAPGKGIIFDTIRTPQTDISPLPRGLGGSWMRYGQSKLANLLYARAFARRHPDVVSVSLHPGVSATGMVHGMSLANKALVYATSFAVMLPPEKCAWNQQWAATARIGDGDREVRSGEYYEPVARRKAPIWKGADEELEEELWAWTQKELKGYAG